MKVPDLYVGKRFFVGDGTPTVLGVGPLETRGSAYVEGPMIVGNPLLFTLPSQFELGSVMCSQSTNIEMKPIPFYALFVRTFARIASFLKVDTLTCTELIKAKIIYTEVLIAKVKNFGIPHPQKRDTTLIYACLEGPENSVYVRGTLKRSLIDRDDWNVIELPEVWKDLVDSNSITVSITPVKESQDIVVDDVIDNKIILNTRSNYIWCYYHVFAERNDVPKLITEVNNDVTI
tara:strand:+ start:137 stop:835 length:699 start_codon:yes stop_codon:yes gene_type:complete